MTARFDPVRCGCYYQGAGWSSPVARWAHNPKVAGSNPAPATNKINNLRSDGRSGKLPIRKITVSGTGYSLAASMKSRPVHRHSWQSGRRHAASVQLHLHRRSGLVQRACSAITSPMNVRKGITSVCASSLNLSSPGYRTICLVALISAQPM